MKKKVYENNWMRVVEEDIEFPCGDKRLFGITELDDGVTILCIDKNGFIFIIEEYRAALKSNSFELISGGIENGENPLSAAKREVEEETGFIAKNIKQIGMINPFTSLVRSKNYIFIAKELEKGVQCWDEGEDLKVHKIKFEDAVSMVKKGAITHGASCVAILMASYLLEN